MARKPYKINAELTEQLLNEVKDSIAFVPGWTVHVTNTERGRALFTTKSITVPAWAMTDPREGYHIYYLCHEMAHAMAPGTKGNIHGPKFMEAFKTICPQEYWHYELSYKPRAAAAAGIARK